jgi:hypothetical protein
MISKLTGTLVFTCLQEPVACYDKEKGKEWKVGIVVDEDTADAWNEIYMKQPAKAVKTVDFEADYKCSPPFPDEKKQYVITLKKNEKLANGEDVPDKYKPKVLIQTSEGREDITQTTLVGNGSLGSVSVDHFENSYGAMARLKNILVTELVEYVKAEGSNYSSGDEFDDEKPVEPPKSVRTASKPVTKTPAKVAAKAASKKVVEDNDGQDPF